VRVTVSSAGRFWAFRLAEQLDRRGMLHRLVATHRPRRGERVRGDRIVSNPWPEVLMRAPRLLGLPWRAGDYLKAVAFDRWASRRVTGCDILVAFASFSLLSLRAARSAGARTVLERGSTHIETQYRLLAEEYRRWECAEPPADPRLVERQLREYDEADYICVPSRFVLRSFLERGFAADRLLHVPFGVDVGRFSPGASPGRPFRILTVGLSLRKGTPYLLEAAARMNAPGVEVWLAGAVSPDLAPVLRRSPIAFRHLGALAHAELASVYRSASVFVLPSVEEGLALVVLEAMASGLPVVATPNTGAEDVIMHGREGLLVPPRDAEALSRALLDLYEDDGRRRAMADAAVRTARAWTWDAYGDRVVAAYKRIIGHTGPLVVAGGNQGPGDSPRRLPV
jgi:glycosyltransferase involved in cell wall biosynthesis